MAGDPLLMILDEPTTGLDPEGIARVFEQLAVRRAAGASAIISTHETSRFSKHCTRVIAMSAGRVFTDLPVEELLAAGNAKTDDLWDVYTHLRKEVA